MRFLAISSIAPGVSPEALNDDMDAEIANGRRLFEEGFLLQGYMDPTYTRAYFIVEASSEAAALEQLGTYPQVQAGLATYELTPLIGLPAIAQVLEAQAQPLPSWWPAD